MIFLITVLFLLVEALHMFHHNDEKFYYLRKIIGVGSEWNKIAFFRLLIFTAFSIHLMMIHETKFTKIYSSIHIAILFTFCCVYANLYKVLYFFGSNFSHLREKSKYNF